VQGLLPLYPRLSGEGFGAGFRAEFVRLLSVNAGAEGKVYRLWQLF
jgi:hypothetical protein